MKIWDLKGIERNECSIIFSSLKLLNNETFHFLLFPLLKLPTEKKKILNFYFIIIIIIFSIHSIPFPWRVNVYLQMSRDTILLHGVKAYFYNSSSSILCDNLIETLKNKEGLRTLLSQRTTTLGNWEIFLSSIMEKGPSCLFSGIHFDRKKFANDFAKFQVIIIITYLLLSSLFVSDKVNILTFPRFRRRKGVIETKVMN